MGEQKPLALITGASLGIGRELALGLGHDGYRLVLIARSLEDLERLHEQLYSEVDSLDEADVTLAAVDVRDEAAVAAVVESAIAASGIDVVINNAGIFKSGNWDSSAEDLRELLATNVEGTMNVLRAVVPHLKQRGCGHIINLSSRRGKVATPSEGIYSASKFAIVGFSEALYKELAPLGIKVTTICPGLVNTRMAPARIPADEMIEPRDILKTVRYLLSLSPSACVKEVFLEPALDLG